MQRSQPCCHSYRSSYSIEAVQASDAGPYYARVSNAVGSTNSSPANLTVDPRPPAVFGLWNFDQRSLGLSAGSGSLDYADGAITQGLTTFERTDDTFTPHIGGQPADFMRVPAFSEAANGYNLTLPMPPNGGGAYVNQYTLVCDILLPFDIYWMPFFNTAPDNDNDAEFYVASDGALGIGDLGYSAPDLIQPGTWYRVAFAANLAIGKVAYYINGQPVFNLAGDPLLDGRFSLASQDNPGPDLRLFNEGDGSGDYTHEVLVNSLLFIDRTLTAQEIAAMGGPSAAGIPAPIVPVLLNATLQGSSQIAFTWQGAPGVRLQKTTSLSTTDWQDVPGTVGSSSAVDTVTGSAAFYRLFRQ